MPVDLKGVYLASGASGKGLRSYAGISMVFHNHTAAPASDRLPRYLDLGYYAEHSIPFTFSSNLLYALQAAIAEVDWERRFSELLELSGWLRPELMKLGFDLIGTPEQTSPAVITIQLPPETNSVALGKSLEEDGYLLSYTSDYLKQHNYVQICLMGECTLEKVKNLLQTLKGAYPNTFKSKDYKLKNPEITSENGLFFNG